MRIGAIFLLVAIAASAQDAAELVRMLQHRPDIRSRGRLVRTDAGRQQRVYQITLVRKLLPQSANMLWTIGEDSRILIEDRFRVPMRIYRDSALALATRRWTEAVAESDFTLEDLAETQFSWPAQTITGKEQCGPHECLVLHSEPDAATPTEYAEVQSWIDRTALLVVHTLKKRKTGAPKEIVTRGLRRVGQNWGVSTIEARTRGEAANTRLVFTSGSDKVRVQESDADPKTVFRDR